MECLLTLKQVRSCPKVASRYTIHLDCAQVSWIMLEFQGSWRSRLAASGFRSATGNPHPSIDDINR
jgi:hypothetical protein